MTKSSWSLRILLTAAAVVTLAGQQLYAQATLVTTTPGDSRAPAVVNSPGARIPNIAVGKDFDTSLTSTDYYTFEPVMTQGPNPDIAVGPDDILVILGKKIARFKNPNAPTVNPTGLNPDNATGSGWVTPGVAGGTLGVPTSEVFLDVWLGGANLNALCPTSPRTNASCIISNASVRYDQMQGRFLVLFTVVDVGATQGPQAFTLGPETDRKASWALVVSKYASLVVNASTTTDIFTSPNPPAIIGGIGADNWTLFTTQTGDTYGNINSIAASIVTTVGAASNAPNCLASVEDQPATPPTPCYIPTDARIGIDNDNIIVTATVFDDNVPLASRTIANTYKGTRVRVYKKDSLYRATPPAPLVAGDGVSAAKVQGDYYDVMDVATPFTIQPGDGGWIYEPEHLRGRSLASFSGNGNLNGQVSYLLGTAADPALTSNALSVRRIDYSATTVASNQLPNNPGTTLVGGIPTLNITKYSVPVTDYTAPGLVPQRAAKTTPAGSTTFFVGDARPRRVIAREGVLYDARTTLENPTVAQQGSFNPGAYQAASVVYDLVSTNQLANVAAPVLPYLVYKTKWGNGNFWAPMFDVPANVLTYGAMSPVNLLPFLEKLFVSGTYGLLSPGPTDSRGDNAAYGTCRVADPGLYSTQNNWAGLFDIRCGEDNYDTNIMTANPLTGLSQNSIYYAARGGSSPDPNDLSMWMYGAYTKGRQSSILGYGQFGTHVSNYSLSFPGVDPYGNAANTYTDVAPNHEFFPYIQIARQTEIAPGGRTATTFLPNNNVTRVEMAYWVVRAQMDETAITAYLNATGGATCSFADVGCPNSTAFTSAPTSTTAASSPLWWRYVETMYRRGYTKGCQATSDVVRRYCPGDNLTRGQMAVFLIRAKMDSVHLTVTSGATPGSTSGDLFSMRYPTTPYFNDVPATHDFFKFIQKMRELRITNGIGNSNYGPDQPLTRGQIAVFLVRAFFI